MDVTRDSSPVKLSLPSPESVPAELRDLKQWVCWKEVPDPKRPGKFRKPPHSAKSGEPIGAIEKYRAEFTDFDGATAGCATFGLSGVGFVFTEQDDYLGVDFDDAVVGGKIVPAVEAWLSWFEAAYQEFSVSGTGLHIIAKGKLVRALVSTPLPNGDGAKTEAYSEGRFFTVSGKRIGELHPIGDCTPSVNKLLEHLKVKPGALRLEGTNDAPHPMSVTTARRIHGDNLAALRSAAQGSGNGTLNAVAYFAARAFAAKAFEQTDEQIKAELLHIVTREWSSPHPEHGARQTINSGWESGLAKPLVVFEERWPQVSQTIEEFNDKYFVVKDFGGKARVCCFKKDINVSSGQSLVLVPKSFTEFRNGYLSEKIQVGERESGPKLETKANVWLQHRHCRKFEEVVFLPNQQTSKGVMNLWKGFAFEARKGDCSLYLSHVWENICQKNQEHYDYLIRWMAYAVHHPDENGHAAIVISGKKGVGKNVFAEKFGDLFGQHSLVVADDLHVTNHFNSQLRDKCLLVADEAFFAGDHRHERSLKSLITGKTLVIEAKGVDPVKTPNLLHIIILGNAEWLVRASGDERRYLALRCGEGKRQDTAFFGALDQQMRNGGYEALLFHLLREIDLATFDVRKVPHTDALREQMAASAEHGEALWQECLDRGEIPGEVQKDGGAWLCTSDLLTWASCQNRSDWKGIKSIEIEKILGKKGLNLKNPTLAVNGNKRRRWQLPPLALCRQLWDEKTFKHDWPERDVWEEVQGWSRFVQSF